ncbi:Endoglucanase 3 [Hordeum vulgare]|nr:Endoglucanase 3 [Hordeum vulgare]
MQRLMESAQREYKTVYSLTPAGTKPSVVVRCANAVALFSTFLAIWYFFKGCRDGTLLKHNLMCFEVDSLVDLMIKVDKYAMADSAMRVKVNTTGKAAAAEPANPKPAGDGRAR